MSRGPGRIEREIEALFTSHPHRSFSTDELVEAVYRGVNRVEKKHRVAVLRAADNVAKRLGCWEKWKCERTWHSTASGCGSIYVNVTDVHSYAIGRYRTDCVHNKDSIAELEARIADGGKDANLIVKGGAWWVHCEQAKAKLGMAVDAETQTMFAKHGAERAAFLEGRAKMFGGGKNQDWIERRDRRKQANKSACICGKCGCDIAQGAPIVRALVSEDSSFCGHRSTSTTVEVQCEACLNACGHARWYYSGRHDCAACGRKVYQRYRRDRMRTFCCEDCKKKNPHGPDQRFARNKPNLSDAA